ncbi:hypothetical protein LC593_34565 [Nostoc sp. CHAB 5844]|nr:hypothetical protein [Nostoc sp. CHAB 5844]
MIDSETKPCLLPRKDTKGDSAALASHQALRASELPIFEPLSVRSKQEEDKELWQPSWNCFCCQDTGKIQPSLIRLVMPDYNYDRDRLPICQLCTKSNDLFHLNEFGVLDTRFDLYLCKKLDAIARDDWKRTTLHHFETVKKRVEKATGQIVHSLTTQNRTQNDNREVQQRKAEIEAISPKQWAVMRTAYLGEDDE